MIKAMNKRAGLRSELGLTQSAAAMSAGISLATWRRWEEDPESVSAKTRGACDRVLSSEKEPSRAHAESATAFETAWNDSRQLTPRQAYAIATELDFWADTELSEWVSHPDEPLHQVAPFDRFSLRVMMLVGENRAWTEAVRQRCYAISNEIEAGVLPFDRPGPFIDEVLIGAALDGARSSMEDMPELFDRIAARDGDEANGDYLIGDEDWDIVSDGFDDVCRWDEWEIPLHSDHPLLPALLKQRPPYTWFDQPGTSGVGDL